MSQIKELQPRPGITLLAVKVPEGAKNIEVTNSPDGSLSMLEFYCAEFWDQYIDLPKGPWQLLGIPTEIPEEVWQGIMHKQSTFGDYYYVGNGRSFKTATEAAMSFLASHDVYSVNPYMKPDIQYYMSDSAFTTRNYHEKLEQWQQAQENTGTRVILRKL